MTTFVIAGDYYEYFSFLKKKGYPRNTSEYVFFSDPTHLLSLHDVKILCVGEYEKSPVYNFNYLLLHQKQSRNIRFVNELGDEV
jgi:hypothetical protein